MVLVTDDMARYVPPDSPWLLRVRATESLKTKLEGVVRLWKAHAAARGDDPAKIDIAHVVRSALDAQIEDTFKDYGGIPLDEEAWKELEAAIAKGVSKVAKSNKTR